jgi:hypothetical protein
MQPRRTMPNKFSAWYSPRVTASPEMNSARGFVRRGPAGLSRQAFAPCFFSTFAHVSFSAIVRLKIGFPGFESGSTQKYPKRSN